ncbi:sigma-70 family RNA polymerase sigma factor [Lentisphaera marina]|uniref:RNA polymerase sigma factor n=1 Tax=Lentisphaera marina TaxID=1111041 RepID=UPI0023662FC7|nr:sigma-70 family RNA polymerase sigma factor [Lentisphaera marina]MDD7984297.1 sigma-70 family RNA polymerase sigma factor [Lentisphaera marina]
MSYRTRLTLMERLKNSGDEKSWDEFNEIYRRFIYSIVRSMYVEAHLIDDLIQDVLLSVWKALPGFEYDPEKGRFSSWLATITINRVKSTQLKRQRQGARDQKAFENEKELDEGDLEHLVNREWAAFLTKTAWQNVSKELSPVMKDCFEGVIAGKKVRDIGKELDIPENTVSIYKKRVSVIMRREIHRLEEELN